MLPPPTVFFHKLIYKYQNYAYPHILNQQKVPQPGVIFIRLQIQQFFEVNILS